MCGMVVCVYTNVTQHHVACASNQTPFLLHKTFLGDVGGGMSAVLMARTVVKRAVCRCG